MTTIVASPKILNEARAAYHALLTGTSPRVIVDSNGERVEFTAANRGSLYTYIQQLETALQTTCGGPTPDLSAYYPAGFTF